jgi:hypothetical protein
VRVDRLGGRSNHEGAGSEQGPSKLGPHDEKRYRRSGFGVFAVLFGSAGSLV